MAGRPNSASTASLDRNANRLAKAPHFGQGHFFGARLRRRTFARFSIVPPPAGIYIPTGGYIDRNPEKL